MNGRIAKKLRKKVYGSGSKSNMGAMMTKNGLRCDQKRGDYKEEKKNYKEESKGGY